MSDDETPSGLYNISAIKDLTIKQKTDKLRLTIDKFQDSPPPIHYCCELLQRTVNEIKYPGVNSKYEKTMGLCKKLNELLLKQITKANSAPVKGPLIECLFLILPFVDKEAGEDFPATYLFQIVSCIVKLKHTEPLLKVVEEYLTYCDVSSYIWGAVLKVINQEEVSDQEVMNSLLILKKLNNGIPKEEMKSYTGSKNQSQKMIKNQVDQIWARLSSMPLGDTAMILLMDVLYSLLLEKMSKPILLTDFLFDLAESRSCVKIYALQGIIHLITTYNIDYPKIYNKVYSFYDLQVGSLNGKEVLFSMTDRLLSSTHLPKQYLIGFVKKLARLCLYSNSKDTYTFLKIITNVLTRNPQVKSYLAPIQGMTEDPYIFEARTLEKSEAEKSWLWELSTLEQHHFDVLALEASKMREGRVPELPVKLDKLKEFDVMLKYRSPSDTMCERSSLTEKNWTEETIEEIWDMET